MAYIYVLRQPLTGESKELHQSTVEFMERMRMYCKEKGYNIQKLFEDDDEEKVGSVPEFAFTYLIKQKFRGQTGFSMDEVRRVTNFFRVPDGSIWYERLHLLMKSDESVSDQIEKASLAVRAMNGVYYGGPPASRPTLSTGFVQAGHQTGTPSSSFVLHPPSAQVFGSPFTFGSSVACPPQQGSSSTVGPGGTSTPSSMSTGLKTDLSSAAKDDPTSNEVLIPTSAPPPSGTANVAVSPSMPGGAANCGFSFGGLSTPTLGTPSEAAGPTLPAFTHGLSQESTKTVTKILGGATSSVGVGSSGFAFGVSAQATMGTSASSNVSSSEAAGIWRNVLGYAKKTGGGPFLIAEIPNGL